MDVARDGPAGAITAPLWYTADRQTRGRGRRGRDWTSAAGNLNATVSFSTNAAATRLPEICLVGAVALREAITVDGLNDDIRLKWPNDLLMSGRKLAGILVETALRPGSACVLMGFGVNLVPVAREERAVAWLGGLDAHVLLERLDASLTLWLSRWRRDGFEETRRAWESAGPLIGEELALSDGRTRGRYEGLGPAGELRLRTADGLITIGHGELRWPCERRETTIEPFEDLSF